MRIGRHQITILDVIANGGGRCRQFILFDIQFMPAHHGLGWEFSISVCRLLSGAPGISDRSLFHLDYMHDSPSLSRDIRIAIGFSKDFFVVRGERISHA